MNLKTEVMYDTGFTGMQPAFWHPTKDEIKSLVRVPYDAGIRLGVYIVKRGKVLDAETRKEL